VGFSQILISSIRGMFPGFLIWTILIVADKDRETT
jgi:hypothetical protein